MFSKKNELFLRHRSEKDHSKFAAFYQPSVFLAAELGNNSSKTCGIRRI